MARTDIHRPSAIVPEDYEFVACEHVAPEDMDPLAHAAAQAEERAIIRAHMNRTGGTYSTHEHGGNCHICGAWAVWTVLFYHAKTNTYIRTGRDCADKLELAYDGADAFKARVTNHLEAQAGKRKAQALLSQAGLAQAWEIAQTEWQPTTGFDADANDGEGRSYPLPDAGKIAAQNTVRDIVSKLVRYGSLSEKQESFLRSLLDRINNWDAVVQQRAIEEDKAAPAPAGRHKVSGTIVSVKLVDGWHGTNYKMLLKADEGFKVWLTVPGILFEGHKVEDLRGQHITVNVTLIPSSDDPKFAFGKRPALVSEEGK